MATAVPSGKFCSPMPMASAIAAPSEAPGISEAAAPKATPTASPSGMLCSVIAETSSTLRRQPEEDPSRQEPYQGRDPLGQRPLGGQLYGRREK